MRADHANSVELLVPALRAAADGDTARAAALASEAVGADPDALLPGALARHLSGDAVSSVYDQPAAFEAFISGGGNVGLYAATGKALAAHHAAVGAHRVLDLGCGDGRALAPALDGGAVTEVTLVEPSRALLDAAVERLGGAGVAVAARHGTAEEFVAGLATTDRWGVAESTFAMHALEPAARVDVLRALRTAADRLVLVEFDVPDLPPGSDEHLRQLAERYEVGLSEYPDGERALVADGFLLPVLLGQLDPRRPRQTWEQPAEAWCEQLRSAGWHDPVVAPVAPYWWAPAVAISS